MYNNTIVLDKHGFWAFPAKRKDLRVLHSVIIKKTLYNI